MFQTYPLKIVGQAYQHRSRPLSAQTCKNMYVEGNPDSKVPAALLPFPGLKNFAASVSQEDRGMHVMHGVLYQIYGTTLCSVNSSGSRQTIGQIPASAGRCVFDNDQTYLVIATGTKRYTYNTSTGVLAEITDSDHESGYGAAYINNQFVFDGLNNNWMTTNAGDPTTINSLNYAATEAKGNNIVTVYAKDQFVYLLAEKSFEVWYNTGTGSPPFDRLQNGVRPVGLASPHAVCETKDYVYIVGDDHQVYRIQQFREQQVTPPAIANAFEGYTVSDSYCYPILFEGQHFVVFQFPTSGKSWLFNESSDTWSELTTDNLETAYPGHSSAYAYNKNLIADKTTGEIWELDLDTFTHDGTEVIRERVTQPISAVDLGAPGQRLLMDKAEFIIETGVGLATGQGSNPTIMVSISTDGGKSFSNEDTIEIGRTGEYTRVRWDHSVSFLEAVIRIRISDPVFFTIHAGSIDVRPDGDY